MSAEGSSSSAGQVDSAEKATIKKKADDLLAQGKRNMVCGEVPKAVNLFEEAVKLLVESCGEMSRDCADAYFNCGCALLELCRMETNVLGTALDGVDIEEEKEEAESEQFEKPPADDASAQGEDEEEDAAENEDAENEDEDAAEEEDPENPDEGGGEKDGDDVSHFQLAWEYLDVAKVIYCKKDEEGDQLKAAECLLKLGELSMETEQHETAAADLESALEIQKKYLKEHDRSIAETHYQLGLAYGLGKDFEKAIQHYQLAIGVIEAKIVSLNNLIEEQEVDADNKENRETDDLMKYKEEIKELQDLIPEMRNKIEDTRVEQKDLEKVKAMAKEMMGLTGPTKGFGSPTKKPDQSGASGSADVDENGQKKPSDIAHLVRKKRKPEEDEPSSSGVELKKSRQENGDSAVSESGASSSEVNGVESSESKKSEAEGGAAVEPMAS